MFKLNLKKKLKKINGSHSISFRTSINYFSIFCRGEKVSIIHWSKHSEVRYLKIYFRLI